MQKRTTQLKQLLTSKELSFLMEAHNGISAKIVEEAGFRGIWGSGLSISAAMGLRDNNEASWTQVLEAVEFMSDVTNIPILLDGDTGYGNFNNMRRLVKKLEQREIAGVCIEDKIFPKTNSFLRGEKQPLADIDEFCGKIKAGLDSRTDDDFCIVARVEAFIAGWDLKEAIKRAEAYRQAGATAILIHSKLKSPEEIFSFMKEWGNRCPVVIVPTKYYATPTEDFRQHGVSTVIWANHNMRSAIKAMQETTRQIYEQESLIKVEDEIATVQEIFRLQNDQELVDAEKRYFQDQGEMSAIILAASRGDNLGDLTADKPKALLNVNGIPVIKRNLDRIRDFGVKDVTVVRGYRKDAFPDWDCCYVDNDEYHHTGELASLFMANKNLKGELFISYGDILFRSYVLNLLDASKADITIVVDINIHNRSKEYIGDYISCTHRNTASFDDEVPRLINIDLNSKKNLTFTPQGEWIGLLKANAKGSELMKSILFNLHRNPNFNSLSMSDLLKELIEQDIAVGVVYIGDSWMDIDNYKDFEQIQGL